MPYQTLQYPFTGGISESLSPEYVDPSSKLLTVQNGTLLHGGGVDKRFGVSELVQPAATPLRIITREAEVLWTDGFYLRSYSPAASGTVTQNYVASALATRTHLASNLADAYVGHTLAEGSGYRLLVNRTFAVTGAPTGDVYATLYDATTGAVLWEQTKLSTGANNFNPIGIIVGGNAYVFWTNGTDIVGIVGTLGATVSWGSATNIVTDVYNSYSDGAGGYNNTTSVLFDACPYSDGTGILIFYVELVGTSPASANARALRLEALPALTVTHNFVVFGGATSSRIVHVACSHDAAVGAATFAWDYTANDSAFATYVQAYAYPAWTSYAAKTTVTAAGNAAYLQGIVSILQGGAIFTTVVGYGAFMAASIYVVANLTAGTATSFGTLAGIIASRPFVVTLTGATLFPFVATVYGSLPFLAVSSAVPQWTCGIINLGLPGPVATSAERQVDVKGYVTCQFYEWRMSAVPPGVTSTAGTYRVPLLVNASEEFEPVVLNIDFPSGSSFYDLVQLDFTGATSWSYVELQAESYISGGLGAMFYDGLVAAEPSFFQPPYLSAAATSAGSSGSLSAGTYGVALFYEAIDGQGLIHRSSPFQFSITVTATQTIMMNVANVPYSYRYLNAGSVSLVEYRTAANGTSYQFVQAVSLANTGPNTFTSIADGTADSAIAINALMPTTGGILSSQHPPSFQCVERYSERVWGIDDTGYNLYMSTQFGGGPESGDAPLFNDELTISFSDEPLTGIKAMDDKLIVLSKSHLWYIIGQGPLSNGTGTDITTATQIPSGGVGASDWRSLVLIPSGATAGGIMFQDAASGWVYLLDRGLNLTWIGREVQDIINATNMIVSASLSPNTNQARFVMAQNNLVVSFDYATGAWNVNTYYGTGLAPTSGATSLTGQWLLSGSITGSPSIPIVAAENTLQTNRPWWDYYSNSGTPTKVWITLSITTAWVKPAGLQGWAMLGQMQGYAAWLDPCGVSMQASYNYNVSQQNASFSYASLSAANGTAAQWAMWPQDASAQAESVQVTLSDTQDAASSTGRGVRWLGLAIDFMQMGPRWPNIPDAVRA
jgi:hypothetical protein